MRFNLKATTALADWLRNTQGERYVQDLGASGAELQKELHAVCAVSPDPAVRAAYARFQLVNEHAQFMNNVRLSKGIEDDE